MTPHSIISRGLDEIGERYRLIHAICVKLHHLYTPCIFTFAYLIGVSWVVTFLIIAPYKYSYVLTDQFLVDIYNSSIEYNIQTRWWENFYYTRPRMLQR